MEKYSSENIIYLSDMKSFTSLIYPDDYDADTLSEPDYCHQCDISIDALMTYVQIL